MTILENFLTSKTSPEPSTNFISNTQNTVLKIYKQQSRPLLSLKWLLAPFSLALTILLIVLVNPTIKTWQNNQQFNQVDQELAALEQEIANDAEIENALAFLETEWEL